MKKKIAFALVLVIALLSVVVIPSFAIEYPNKSVSINKNQSVAHSGSVSGTYKLFAGNNDYSSERNLYFQAQFSTGSGWTNDNLVLISPGSSFDNQRTTTGTTSLWRLELNPYGVLTKGCIGKGYIWYDMQLSFSQNNLTQNAVACRVRSQATAH